MPFIQLRYQLAAYQNMTGIISKNEPNHVPIGGKLKNLI